MNKKRNLKDKILNILLNVLICLFVLILLVSFYTTFQVKILKNDYTNFFGYSLFEVQTGSMSDAINPGDWIIIKLTKNVGINDVVTFRQNNDFITHRVIEVYQGTYVTKGDANPSKDDPIDQNQIVGKVVKVLGGFGIIKKTILNPFVILTLIITLFLFNAVFKKDNKKEFIKKKNISKSTVYNNEKFMIKDSFKDIYKSEDLNKPFSQKIEVKVNDDVEEKLSKTSIYRVVSADNTDVKMDYVKEEIPKVVSDEELSKTSMFRIISADTSDVDPKVKNIVEKENKKEIKNDNVYKVTLNAEKVVKTKTISASKEEEVNIEDLKVKLNSKKCKNIIEKSLSIKELELNEIIDVLLKSEKVYVINSNIRNLFLNNYIDFMYLNLSELKTGKNLQAQIKKLADEIIVQNSRDEKKQNIALIYAELFVLISDLEKNRNVIADKLNIYKSLLSKYNRNLNTDDIDYMVDRIISIQKYCSDILDEILKKLETSMFDLNVNKLVKKDLYGIELAHNISFSKIYSDYIVDKTYNEGIIAEDKVAVLFTLLLGKLVKNMINLDYGKKYIFYITAALYEKEKKLDGLMRMLDNDYAKGHVYILVKYDELAKNIKIIKNLRKKGYHFVLGLDKQLKLNKVYLELVDYILIDKNLENISAVLENIPSEFLGRVIKDNIKNKIGDFGSE